MRLFLAARIPEETVQSIVQTMTPIKKEYPRFQWVPEENYHLTIFFFGERPHDKLPDLIEGVNQVTFDIAQTQLSTRSLKLFVDKGITLYAEFNRNKELETIRKRIISSIGSKKLEHHQQYIPHVTLAQYKLPSKQQYFHLKKKLTKVTFDQEFRLNEICLMQSTTQKPFPSYKHIHTFNLYS